MDFIRSIHLDSPSNRLDTSLRSASDADCEVNFVAIGRILVILATYTGSSKDFGAGRSNTILKRVEWSKYAAGVSHKYAQA